MDYGRAWSITTNAGHRFVLKQLADADLATRRQRVAKETRIIIHLAQRGVPVAVPILCDDGGICAEHDNALWTLSPMLPMPDETRLPAAEAVLEENADYRTGVGRTIAQMHLALADCPYEIDRETLSLETFVRRWDRLRAELPAATFEALRRRVDPRWERTKPPWVVALPNESTATAMGATSCSGTAA